MKPIIQAMVLADHVYEDKSTGKKIIAGTFNQLLFSKKPRRPATGEPASPSDSSGSQASAPATNGGAVPAGAASEAAVPAGSSDPARQPIAPPPAIASKLQAVPGGMQSGSPYLYISLTDAQGDLPLVIRYVDLESNESLFQAKATVRCKDRLQTIEMVVPLPALPTPHSGVYALELLSDGEPLASLRVKVQEIAH